MMVGECDENVLKPLLLVEMLLALRSAVTVTAPQHEEVKAKQ